MNKRKKLNGMDIFRGSLSVLFAPRNKVCLRLSQALKAQSNKLTRGPPELVIHFRL
jgi:hypothetical protein